MAELRLEAITAPLAELFTILSNQVPAGLLIAVPIYYGLVSDITTLRLTVSLLPGHKSAYMEVFRIAAAHLFRGSSTLVRLEHCVEAANLAACKALEDSGWRREGLLRGALLTDAGRKDAALYSLLRSDM